ncbi:hypothetical protein [Paenibacillus sp. Z3-2]
MKTRWDIYECECGLGYAIRQEVDNEIEEPACPHCGGTDARLIQLKDGERIEPTGANR